MSNDDFFLCRTFAKAIGAEKLEQRLVVVPPAETLSTWKVGNGCLCPFSEDQLIYKATIIGIASPSCTVSFDDYGNEEEHLLTELQTAPPIVEEEEEVIPSAPPMPVVPEGSSDLSSTLMSWYLAGYHTGFYQAMKK